MTKYNTNDMHVIKRNGKKEIFSFDKILKRIKSISKEMNLENIICAQLAMKVIDQLYDNIKTSLIDELSAEQCASMASTHTDYTKLASAITISNLHKNTDQSFYNTIKKLYDFKDVNNNTYKLIHSDIMAIVEENKEYIDSIIKHERDYLLDYFGYKTLERAYLMRCNNDIVERPQHMWLRVSLCIHGSNFEKVKETYDLMSQKYFIHATPTLFNAGTPRPQLSSCYLIAMENDSIDGIFNTVKECAEISKWSGGIGLHIHNIRSNGSHIRGTNGTSNGLVPMLGVFNKTARYVDQGGKRNGSFAIYLEPHHPDIEDFLELKKNHGDEESKARDLFYALWISDLFMERVMGNKTWSLFCPDKCPGLSDCYGEEYNRLYNKYEESKLYNKQINARDLWMKILDAQMETGTPYLLFKDACNKKSNQQNLGTIKSSNLCVAPETMILTDKGYIEIQTLKDTKVNVWNGKEFSNTIVKQTSEHSELIQVYTNDGCCLTCTKYHKFYIEINNMVTLIEAKDLKNGMKLSKSYYFPIIDNTEYILENAYQLGFMQKNTKYFVPINYSLKTKIDWFSGYCDAYGYLSESNDILSSDNEYLYLLCDYKVFLLEIKYMLQTCGINVYILQENSNYKLTLSYLNIQILLKHGFRCKYYSLTQTNKNFDIQNSDYSNDIYIEKIIDNSRKDKTFCFNEPKHNSGFFNGMLTSQCTEIIEYSDEKETAVCNLASIGLSMYVKEDKTFDYEKLYQVTKILVDNLNNIIDINFYPTKKTCLSNFKHRPIGIGVQGLADVFFKMDISFTSDKAKEVNKLIFETIYFAALERSYEISFKRNLDLQYLKEEYGYQNWSFTSDDLDCREYNVFNITSGSSSKTLEENDKVETLLNKYRPIKAEIENLQEDYLGSYSSFKNSPISRGELQYDLWNTVPDSTRYDWTNLKEKIMKYGIRNSLLCAPMPTASTSQILGNNECFEPITSNIYSRRTLAGEFILINKYLVEELLKLKLWNENVKNNIIANNGSIKYIEGIPDHIKDKYKIVWEMSMKDLIDMSRDRGKYICQSQSLNLWVEDPDPKILTNMHFYSWRAGLKTGIYYLRRKPKHQPQQFTIEPEKNNNEDKEGCLMCSG